MWREFTLAGVDYQEKCLKFGLNELRLVAGPDFWHVLSGQTRIIYGQAESMEAAREQAVAATLTMLRDAQKRLKRETCEWEVEPV